MAYQTPQLVLVGTASNLVLGLVVSGPFGLYVDNVNIPDEGIVLGNSRYVVRP